jgi:hypothetical protein
MLSSGKDIKTLSELQKQQLKQGVHKKQHCFAHHHFLVEGYCGPCGDFRISSQPVKPIYKKPRRLPLERPEAGKVVKSCLKLT